MIDSNQDVEPKTGNAINSLTVIFSHLSNFSGPITNLACALLCFTISHIRSGEKYKSNTSTGSEGISSTGPVGEVNGWIGMLLVVVIHEELEGPAAPGEPEPGRAEPTKPEPGC